jgi:hypothetical protein
MTGIRAFAFPFPSRPEVSARHLSILSATSIVIANNGTLFKAITERLRLTTLQGEAFVGSIYLLRLSA